MCSPLWRPARPTLFPYTTLFRSVGFCAGLLAAAAAMQFPDAAHAQSYPSRAINLVVPFPAGGRTDLIGRILAQNLQDRKSTRLNSSHLVISYAVFCLKKKKTRGA